MKEGTAVMQQVLVGSMIGSNKLCRREAAGSGLSYDT
jgi:hypothetical protein